MAAPTPEMHSSSHGSKLAFKLAIFGAITAVTLSTMYICYKRSTKKKISGLQSDENTCGDLIDLTAEKSGFQSESIPKELIESSDLAKFESEFLALNPEGHPQDHENRLEFSDYAKRLGNVNFSKNEMKKAINCYTKGIHVINWQEGKRSARLHLLYGNIAACYMDLEEYSHCVDYCTKAILLEPSFLKVYERRAKAYLKLGKQELACRDLIAVSILKGFKDRDAMKKLESCLMTICSQKAEQIISQRKDFFPSSFMIQEYLQAFSMPTASELSKFPACLSSAFAKLQQRQYQEASLAFHSAVQEIPASAANNAFLSIANEMSGTFDLLCGDLSSAKNFLISATALNPENFNAAVKLSNCFLESSSYQDAKQTISQAKEKFPNNQVVLYHEAELLAMASQLDQAIEIYSKVIELDSHFILAYVHQARAMIGSQKHEDAAVLLEKALKSNPDDAQLLNCLAEAKIYANLPRVAMDILKKAAELMPENPTIWLNMSLVNSHVMNNSNSIETSIEYLEKAIEKDPKFDSAYHQLGIYYLQVGNNQLAYENFEKAADLTRNSEQLVNILMVMENAKNQEEVCRKSPFLNQKYTELVAEERNHL